MKQPAAKLFVKRFARTHGASEMQKWLDTGQGDAGLESRDGAGDDERPRVGETARRDRDLDGRLPGDRALQSLLGDSRSAASPVQHKNSVSNRRGGGRMGAGGFPIPVSNDAYGDGTTLPPTKVGCIVALSEEFAMLANVGTAPAMRRWR